MFNLMLLTALSRQRQRDVARDVALCHYALRPRVAAGRVLRAVGALIVHVGAALDRESELPESDRRAEVTAA